MDANMLAAYYTKEYDSHELFDHLKIAQSADYEKYMNRYNMIIWILAEYLMIVMNIRFI